ncbi:TPA: hypothetical protein IX512_000786 [Enterococcus faecium]|uniref:hypothetical protein n=1 Tax=Enterococcus faecalis TaxID=1351 RepID=UPI000A54B0E4|nr:hypothetical protein [Enterococcus faecalis]MDV4498657.1 hypothetical protein [Enterococcus faecium]MCE2569422.1 hypothetical protein [Enterococcus faecalis]HAQ2240602.1 hypothetical protein [Enterococcus faecium]HAQ6403699.1 hypothetical protein [Enterococcus faecium]HAQ6450782.1 hypothetical protein [Enterococcus faecium]
MVKRTKKIFRDYNVYRDRPFPLKWGTAFAMDDLMKGVRKNNQEALKINKLMPQMTRAEIDDVLAEAFLTSKEIELQLNLRDDIGRLIDKVSGKFLGEAYEDYFVLANQTIYWEDVRKVKIKETNKWFNVSLFEQEKRSESVTDEELSEEISLVKDEFFQPFLDDRNDEKGIS